MISRKLKKSILAVILAVPLTFSFPDLPVNAENVVKEVDAELQSIWEEPEKSGINSEELESLEMNNEELENFEMNNEEDEADNADTKSKENGSDKEKKQTVKEETGNTEKKDDEKATEGEQKKSDEGEENDIEKNNNEETLDDVEKKSDEGETGSVEKKNNEEISDYVEENDFFAWNQSAEEENEFSGEEFEEKLNFLDDFEVTEGGETEDMISLQVLAPTDFVQEGVPVRNGNNGFTPVNIGETIFNSRYTRLGWNADSQVVPWNNAGNNVVLGRREDTIVCGPYFVPLNDNAKGKFGFRVTHAGYNKDANTKVDLLLTCVDYKDYTYDYKGNKLTGIYPLFGMRDSVNIWLLFKRELPMMEIKIDIVKSGTNTPVPGNYRFRWLDIDEYQRFAIRLQNGTVGHKYATKDSVVNVDNKYLFNKNYEALTAPAEEVTGEVPKHTVVYELDNSSGFYLAILMPGYNKHSVSSTNTIKNAYEQVITGTVKATSGLNWDAKAYGSVEYPTLTKKTGNSLSAQGTSNELTSSLAGYYYTLQTDIPEEYEEYYYSSCVVKDTLPAGVDYNGLAVVKTLPSETNVSSWFNIYTDGDVIRFEAKATALASADFYGKTYEFQIGVKMDPTEVNPVYSGENYSYEVKNKASITCRHKNQAEGTNWSNEVSTICKKTKSRLNASHIQKSTANLQANTWGADILLPGENSTFQYKLSVNVPANEPGGYLNQLDVADTLPAGVDRTEDAVTVYDSLSSNVTDKFQITTSGKQITVKAKAVALGTAAFYGKQYDIVFRAKMNPEQLTPAYNGNVASYSVSNRFSVTTKHRGDSSSATLYSNNTVDRASVTRIDPEVPSKWILSENQYFTSKEYKGRTFETVFEIQQKIPAYKREWTIKKFKFSDNLAGCLEIKNAVLLADEKSLAVFEKTGGNSNGWKMEANGNLAEVWYDGLLPVEYYGKTLKLRMTVGLKENCDLQAYYVTGSQADILEAHIYNIASSTFEWSEGIPASVTKNSDRVELIVKEDISRGTLTVSKTDRDGKKLSGAVFLITAAKEIRSASGNVLLKAGAAVGKFTTGDDGSVVAENLYPGEYKIQEIKAPDGYVLNEASQTVEISRQEMQRQAMFVNDKTLVKIKKIAEKEKADEKPNVISGAEFYLWEKDGSKENGTSYQTDENGMIEIKGLKSGVYQFQEISVPSGYILDSSVKEFLIDENGLVNNEYGYTIVIENTYTKAEFMKTDKASGSLVAGATLQLKDKNGKTVDTWVSGMEPHRINKLVPGEYVLTEVEAPEGYKKGKPISCVIEDTAQIQDFRMTNVKMVTITLTKIIHGDELVWAHGNPVFTFLVEGTDLDGENYACTDCVEFSRKNSDTRADVERKIVFTVPAGVYYARELKTVRYDLENIDKLENGKIQEKTVQFVLNQNENGSAAFINRKINDDGLTDTDFVRNVIVPE